MAKIARSVGIHDGAFHADEVTACALLLVFDLIDEEKIIRTRDCEKLERTTDANLFAGISIGRGEKTAFNSVLFFGSDGS